MNSKAQDEAKKRYDSKRIKLTTSFNPETEQHLLDKVDQIREKTGLPFSVWVKKMIEEA